MLQVGIHENIKLGAGTGFNEKGYFKLHLEQSGSLSTFEAFMEDESIEKNEVSLIMFVPQVLKFNKVDMKSADEMAKELQTIRNWLRKILQVYLTEDQLKQEFSQQHMFSGMGQITEASFKTLLTQETSIKAICNNLFQSFIAAVTKYNLTEKETTFRIKFVRSSKKSNYPAIPKNKDVWIESMKISKEESKIKYSQYEIDNEMNSTAQPKKDATPEKEVKTADALFDTSPEPVVEQATSVNNQSIGDIEVEQAPDIV